MWYIMCKQFYCKATEKVFSACRKNERCMHGKETAFQRKPKQPTWERAYTTFDGDQQGTMHRRGVLATCYRQNVLNISKNEVAYKVNSHCLCKKIWFNLIIIIILSWPKALEDFKLLMAHFNSLVVKSEVIIYQECLRSYPSIGSRSFSGVTGGHAN